MLNHHRKGLGAREAAFAVKQFKSHRRVGTAREIRDAIAAQGHRKAFLK